MLKPAPLVESFLTELARSARLGPIIDLACGTGRNGLYLVENGLPVVFADTDEAALARVLSTLSGITSREQRARAECWCVDLEAGRSRPLDGKRFGGIMG